MARKLNENKKGAPPKQKNKQNAKNNKQANSPRDNKRDHITKKPAQQNSPRKNQPNNQNKNNKDNKNNNKITKEIPKKEEQLKKKKIIPHKRFLQADLVKTIEVNSDEDEISDSEEGTGESLMNKDFSFDFGKDESTQHPWDFTKAKLMGQKLPVIILFFFLFFF